MRHFLLFIHIAGVAGWIGGGLFAMYGFGRLAREGGSGNGRAMETIFEKSGTYFTVMFLLVVGAGVGLVINTGWGWGDTFVWVGIGAIVASGMWQGMFARRSNERLVDAVKSESQERAAVIGAWRRTAWIDVAILLVAVWAMVTKLSI